MVAHRFGKPVVVCIAVIALVTMARIYLLPFAIVCFPSPQDAYATDWTSIFVIDHIRTSGEWPSRWEDLRDEFDRLAPESHYAWTFEELQGRVWIDFDVDLDDVRDADPPIHLFELTSGRQLSYNGDPNLLIRDYLRTGNDPWRVDPPIGENGGPGQNDPIAGASGG